MARSFTNLIPKTRLAAAFALLCLPQPGRADGPTVAVRALSWEVPQLELQLHRGSSAIPIAAPAYEPGAPVDVPPATDWQLMEPREPTPDDPEPFRQVGSVDTQTDARALLLVVLPLPPSQSPDFRRVFLFPDDLASFPAGSERIINLTPFVINARLGGIAHTLDPFQQAIFLPEKDRHGRYRAQVAYETNEGKSSPVENTVRFLRDTDRGTTLITWTVGALDRAEHRSRGAAAGDFVGGEARVASLRFLDRNLPAQSRGDL